MHPLNTDRTRTSPYHAQGNGQVERHNSALADVISKHCSENPRERESVLPYAEFVYNTVHKRTGGTPLSLVLGDEAVYPIVLLFSKTLDIEHTEHKYTQLFGREVFGIPMCACETLGAAERRQKDKFF